METDTDKAAPVEPGRFAYQGLDRVLHEKARLGILVSLITQSNGLSFGELKNLCALTDGNLSRHLDVLCAEALIAIEKTFEGRRPLTRVRLTEIGRTRFLAYLAELERVVHDAMLRHSDNTAPLPGLQPG